MATLLQTPQNYPFQDFTHLIVSSGPFVTDFGQNTVGRHPTYTGGATDRLHHVSSAMPQSKTSTTWYCSAPPHHYKVVIPPCITPKTSSSWKNTLGGVKTTRHYTTNLYLTLEPNVQRKSLIFSKRNVRKCLSIVYAIRRNSCLSIAISIYPRNQTFNFEISNNGIRIIELKMTIEL